MAGKARNREASPFGELLIGIVLVAGTRYAFNNLNVDAGMRLWLQVFQFTGAFSIVLGLAGLHKRWRIRQARKEAMAPSDAYGGSDFATLDQCEEAGLTDPRGLYLGVLDGRPLFFRGKTHLLTVAPSGAGKSISMAIPNLLHFQGSVFVTDPKGELAAVTSKHRRERLGQDVVVLNPWELHGLPSSRYNPLAPLMEAANDPKLARGIGDEARALALQLLPEPPNAERNQYFREGSRSILRTLMLHLATRDQPENCTLPQLWRIVNNTKLFEETLEDMEKSKALGGMVKDMADDLASQILDNPSQFADFRAGATQAVSIFDPSGWLGASVSGSDVDFRALKERSTSVYVVIPQEKIAANGAWLGLVTRQAISAVAASGGSTPVLFMLDEFANMGKLSGLSESLAGLRALGVRVWMIVQDLAQLEQIYGPNIAAVIRSQSEVKQFFVVQNERLAKELSANLGERTIKTQSYNLGRYADEEVSISVSEKGRPLLSPDEIRLMPREDQLIFVSGLPPIRARRVPFWLVSPWQGWVEPNPVEGPYPQLSPVLKLRYTEKRTAAE